MMDQEYNYTPLPEPIPITEQVWPEGTLPLVSICSITYNHESYIKECLEGFLMQKTTFPVEIIIHDDASTDKTAEIIKEYELKYPNLFKPIYQVENQFSKKQGSIFARFVYPKAIGKYIALCEGDDYWIDPLKLQKQVDFLEANPEYGVVYTDFITVNKDSIIINKKLKRKPLHPIGNVKEYLIKKNFVQTLTILVRSDLCKDASQKMSKQSIFQPIDYALFFELAGRTMFYFISDITSAYRVLQESASHSSNIEDRIKFLNNSRKILKFYNERYNLGLSDRDFKEKEIISKLREYSKFKEYKMFFITLFNGFLSSPLLFFKPIIYYHLLYLLFG